MTTIVVPLGGSAFAEAEDADASLLVVGTRGLGAVRGPLLGSVAGYVARYARYARRPIAVVPNSTG